MDIRVETQLADGQAKIWNLDTSVVNPCCYVNLANQRFDGDYPPDRPAAREMERRQSRVTREDYVRMVPLVVEATGRLGPAFEDFLREVGEICGAGDRPDADEDTVKRILYKNKAAVELASLRYDVGSLIARFNGYKILALRDRQRWLVVPPPRL